MTNPQLTCIAVYLGFVAFLPGCGSSDSGSGPGNTAGDSGDSSTAGSDGEGGAGTGGSHNATGEGGEAVAGTDGGAAGTSSGGDAGSGAAGASVAGGASGAGGSGAATDGWFCAQVGEACSCIPTPAGNPSQNSCTKPQAPCCFTFDYSGQTDCQCQPTSGIACPSWLAATNGTQVSACPPP